MLILIKNCSRLDPRVAQGLGGGDDSGEEVPGQLGWYPSVNDSMANGLIVLMGSMKFDSSRWIGWTSDTRMKMFEQRLKFERLTHTRTTMLAPPSSRPA